MSLLWRNGCNQHLSFNSKRYALHCCKLQRTFMHLIKRTWCKKKLTTKVYETAVEKVRSQRWKGQIDQRHKNRLSFFGDSQFLFVLVNFPENISSNLLGFLLIIKTTGEERVQKGRERFLFGWKKGLYSHVGSTNLNGKFWNFWPNFIHLKSFSVVCYHRVWFSFTLLYKGTGYIWKYLCLMFMLFFLSTVRKTRGITTKRVSKEKKEKHFAGQI